MTAVDVARGDGIDLRMRSMARVRQRWPQEISAALKGRAQVGRRQPRLRVELPSTISGDWCDIDQQHHLVLAVRTFLSALPLAHRRDMASDLQGQHVGPGRRH